MKRLIALGIAVSFAMLTSACNTMHGFGQDVEKGGEKIKKESTEHKNY